jgi:ankyrin repeat protein/ribosomal protein L7/L12
MGWSREIRYFSSSMACGILAAILLAVVVNLLRIEYRAAEEERARLRKAGDELLSSDHSSGTPMAARNELEQLVVDSLRHGKIEAIRTYRKATGAHLAEAKEAVETISKLHGIRDEAKTGRRRLWQIALPAAILAGFAALVAAGPKWLPEFPKRVSVVASAIVLLLYYFGLWMAIRSHRASLADESAENPPQPADATTQSQRGRALKFLVALLLVGLVTAALATGSMLFYFARQKTHASQELPAAARAGDVKRVKALLAQGADVEAKDQHGNPAIVAAAIGGSHEVIELLTTRGANVNARDAQGETALMEAAFNGHYIAVEQLLVHGYADATLKDQRGQTALYWAVAGGHSDIFGKLLPYVRQDLSNEKDAQGNPLLTVAAIRGNVPMIKRLLVAWPDADVRDAQGETPLMEAAYNGHVNAVEELLRAKTPPNVLAKDNSGATALDWAVARGQEAVVDLLLKKGAEETGAYFLWRGCQAGLVGNYSAGVEKLTKATELLASVKRRIVFQIDDERYVTQHPQALALAMLAECELQSGKAAEARQHYELLKPHVQDGSLPLYSWVKLSLQAMATGEFDADNHVVNDFSLSSAALEQALTDLPKLPKLYFKQSSVHTTGTAGSSSRVEQTSDGTADGVFAVPK